MPLRVALIGANGQLATDLARAMARRAEAYEVVALRHDQIEVVHAASASAVLAEIRPDLVINTAAYHKVDEVEDNPERAFAVNAVGVRNLALACRDLDATLLHLSTDYVFSGRKGQPYVESDPVDPINVYGVSKAAGEMALRYLWPKHLIVRTSGLYGLAGSAGKGGNFVELMLRLAGEGRPIRVVDDQTLTPTPTHALAPQILRLVEAGVLGTYHATCNGACTWFTFAAEIFRFRGLRPVLSPQTTAESGAKARRPSYSVLENANLEGAGLDGLPLWQEGLEQYLRARERSGRG